MNFLHYFSFGYLSIIYFIWRDVWWSFEIFLVII